MPTTFMVFMFICETGMLGSMGEVASTVTMPTNPVQRVTPDASMLTPAGTGCAENGFPRDHSTGGVPVMGAMLYIPTAVKCTMLAGKLIASAEAGDTVMLCNWRLDIMVDMPPQETATRRMAATNRKRTKAEDLRIDTSKQAAVRGKR